MFKRKLAALFLIFFLLAPSFADAGGKVLSRKAKSDTYTKLLIKAFGANNSTTFKDFSQTGHTITANGDAKMSTTQAKFPPVAIYCDGTGDYLSASYHADFALGSGDFTIAAWVYITVLTGGNYPGIISRWNEDLDRRLWTFSYSVTEDTLNFNYSADGITGVAISKAWNPSINTWYHTAVTRSGNDFRLFVDGTQIGTTTTAAVTIFNHTSEGLLICARKNNGFLWEGYIDQLILKNQAVWTSNFTPPTRRY